MKFLRELSRRRVYRLAGLYIVGAWIVIEVASVFFPAWGIPDTALRFLFIAAVACFPVALIFSWYYDITTAGIVRTRAAHADEAVDLSLRRSDYIVLTALLAVGAAVLVGSADKIQEEIESGHIVDQVIERLPNSLAVLPFKNLDIKAETGYFSDGITEEILHRLSTLGTLHVLASGSSFNFRNSEKAPAQISKALGVRYLLNGSIRRADNYVRITARLLDESGYQLWSETFDRELTEIFAVQTEIAREVSRQIVNEIVLLAELPAGRTTSNMEAYNAYLLGRYQVDSRTQNWKDKADEAFNRAIELDPGFAPPYAGLATLVVNSPVGPHWEEALELAAKALELDPELAEGHAIHGLIAMVLGDPAAGEVSLERAIELNPSLSSAYNWLNLALLRQNRPEEALAVRNRGLVVDPLNPGLVANTAAGESILGNFERAEQLLLRLAGLPQVPGPAYDILNLYDDWGRYGDELAMQKTFLIKTFDPDEPPGGGNDLAITYAKLGMTGEADYWYEKQRSLLPEDEDVIHEVYYLYRLYNDKTRLTMALDTEERHVQFQNDEHRAYFLGYGGMAQIQAGNFEKGVEWLETSFDLYLEMYRPDSPADGIDVMLFYDEWYEALVIPMMQRMAFAYQRQDRQDDANDILHQLEQVLTEPEPKDPLRLEWHALQSALRGDVDGAYKFLSAAAELGWANYYEVVNDPAWANAVATPEFQDLLRQAKERVDEMRQAVESEEAEHDFRAEVQQLLAN